MIAKSLTLIFSFSLTLIVTNASVCNKSILLENRFESFPANIDDTIVMISEGQNLSVPQFNSSKVFVFSILQHSSNHITYTFNVEYTITAIGIRQLFREEEICPNSNNSNLESIYNISYKVSPNDELQYLDYPIGTIGKGRLNPWLTLPYMKIRARDVYKTTLKIAIKPTRVRTVKIQKEIEYLNGVISNGGKYCLQFELYGCTDEHPREAHSIVLEYQMPEPAVSSDDAYTGLCSENTCTGGIGKLVDESSGDEPGTVFWDIDGPEIFKNIQLENSSFSIMKILFIFDDVHFIEKINIFTFNTKENAIPLFISANGLMFETRREISSFSHVTLSPWINVNSVLLEFYFDESAKKPRIAISEVSFVEYKQESVSSSNVTIEVATLSAVSVLLFILFALSVTVNFILLVKKTHKKLVLQTIPSTKEEEEDIKQTESTYEIIPGNSSRYSTVYSEPNPVPVASPFNPNVSVIEMPSNPTYVSSLKTPIKSDENLPGYSHLDFSEATEKTSEEKKDVAMRERPKSKILSASQRRSSYFDQHMLSDLK